MPRARAVDAWVAGDATHAKQHVPSRLSGKENAAPKESGKTNAAAKAKTASPNSPPTKVAVHPSTPTRRNRVRYSDHTPPKTGVPEMPKEAPQKEAPQKDTPPKATLDEAAPSESPGLLPDVFFNSKAKDTATLPGPTIQARTLELFSMLSPADQQDLPPLPGPGFESSTLELKMHYDAAAAHLAASRGADAEVQAPSAEKPVVLELAEAIGIADSESPPRPPRSPVEAAPFPVAGLGAPWSPVDHAAMMAAAEAAMAMHGPLPQLPSLYLYDPMAAKQLRDQVEYYFSVGNLSKDVYLRLHMSEDGWTPLELIAGFPKVARFAATMTDIAEVLRESEVLEVDPWGVSVRLRAESLAAWSVAPEQPSPAPAPPVQAEDPGSKTAAAADDFAPETRHWI